jgi:hypothetical protein
MKTPIMIGIAVLVLAGLIAGVSFYYASLAVPADPGQHPADSSSPISVGQLRINNLSASTNGAVSLNVTLYDCDSAVVDAVIINGTSYLWGEGSAQNSTVFKGQTKGWGKNIGGLNQGDRIQVTLQAIPETATETATVNQLPSPDAPDVPDQPKIPTLPSYFYDYYSGVGLFDRGVYFTATSQDPLTQLPISSLPKNYWALIRENVTALATDQDFVSIIVSRGDFPTGGYMLQIETFSWLESGPVKFRFQVNFTDPGEGVIVTEAFTNPLVLVPIGHLSPGRYQVEVHIVSYILTYDAQGQPSYRPIMTFREEVWTQTLTVTGSQNPAPSTTFKVMVNSAPFSDLAVPLDVSSDLTREKAQKIAEATFVHVKGEKSLFRLDDLTFNEAQITARYTWGLDGNDMGHIFELVADLKALQITVTHCR